MAAPTFREYQNVGGKLNRSTYNGYDDAQKQVAYDNAKASGGSTTPPSTASGMDAGSTIILDQKAQETLKNILKLTDAKATAEQRTLTLQSLAVEMIQKEGKIRKTIVRDLGQIGDLQTRNVKIIAEAGAEAALYGVSMDKLLETVSTLSKTIGRNIAFDDEDINRIAIFSEAMDVSLYDVTQMVKQFEMMGIGIDGAIDKGNEMAEVARNMGVNMERFMEIITDNMDMMNTYNFADGVKGFAKMAAQAQRLGLSMSTTASLAEKVMDPEGAVELAANLQVIGGAVGDLADPFKLMYMATNDVAGLQDALVNAGKDLVMFNEATGEMSIPPTAQRQMRAMAETLGMSKEEFAEMIKLQGKFDAVMNQLDPFAFTKEMEDSGMGDYIASIAQMGKGGRYQVQVDGEMVNVDSLTPEQMAQIQEDARLKEQQDKLSEKDIMLEQTTILEAMNRSLHAISAKGFEVGMEVFQPGVGGQPVAEGLTKGMEGVLKDGGDYIKDVMMMGMNGVFIGNSSSTDPIDWGSIGDTIGTGIEGGLGGLMNTLDELFKKFGENFKGEYKADSEYEGQVSNMDDFTVSQGQTQAVITSKGMIIPSKKDTLIGVDLTASPTTPNMGALNTSTTTNQTITLNTNKIEGSIDLKLDGRNLGKMSGREIVDAIFSNQTNANVLKEAIASINTKTAPGGINEMNSPFA